MQREIKFRGQRVDTKEWVYGSLIITTDAVDGFKYIIMPIFDNGMYTFDDGDLGFEKWYKVIPETVGQYTGLNDKNGKEIYEGDYGEHATSEWNDNYEIGFYVESTSEEEIDENQELLSK